MKIEKNTRGLSPKFMEKLKEGGDWNFITEEVKKDHTLLFQIRNNYINIYYRGCSILRLEEKGMSRNSIAKKYHEEKIKDIDVWKERLPYIKQGVDNYLSNHNKLERVFQQLIASENISNGTDYFILDTEYATKANAMRCDMVGINKDGQLAFFELKYKEKSLGKYEEHLKLESGIYKHFKDVSEHICEKDFIENLYEEMKIVLEQLQELGVVPKTKKEVILNKKIEYILVCIFYNLNSTILKRELEKVRKENILKPENVIYKYAGLKWLNLKDCEKKEDLVLKNEDFLSLEDFEKLLKK